jgi:hypothetical protein
MKVDGHRFVSVLMNVCKVTWFLEIPHPDLLLQEKAILAQPTLFEDADNFQSLRKW